MAARRGNWAKRAAGLTNARVAQLRNAPFALQLATLGDAPPKGDTWLSEIKWDGFRIAATIVGGEVRLWSRNGIEWTEKTPTIAAALASLNLQSAALDGELIAGGGRQADFNTLQATLAGRKKGGLTLVLFDVLHLDGYNVERAPLIERKTLLEELLSDLPDGLAYSSHSVGAGDTAFAFAAEREFEGIISKRSDRPYVHGRGDDWRKTKSVLSDEFAVVGYTPPKGSRNGFGSLLLAKPDGPRSWVYVGRVGSGFSGELIRTLLPHLQGGSEEPTVRLVADGRASLRGATWFPPRFVAEVHLRGISETGLLRQPSLKAVRPDKSPADLRSSDRPKKSTR